MKKLTLNQIKDNPKILTFEIPWTNEVLLLRPLEPKDNELLASFLEGLSSTTRKNYTLDDFGPTTAAEFCNAIARYDKLRFLLLLDETVIGLFEFSMDIPDTDKDRLLKYKLDYSEDEVCRFGPCLADAYQNKGLAKLIFPYIKGIAKKTGNNSILLWGGVLKDNIKAIRFYKKVGFKELGEFINKDYNDCIDMILHL